MNLTRRFVRHGVPYRCADRGEGETEDGECEHGGFLSYFSYPEGASLPRTSRRCAPTPPKMISAARSCTLGSCGLTGPPRRAASTEHAARTICSTSPISARIISHGLFI